MARKVSTDTRQDLLQAVRERYRGSLKEDKLRILDEFVAVTGYHRKHVIRLFNAAPVTGGLVRRARLPVGLELPILALSPGLSNVARRRTFDLR